MFRAPYPFDFLKGNSDFGPGVGYGFGIGVLVYVASWILVLMVSAAAFPRAVATVYASANLISHVGINGGLIWRALAVKRIRLAQGLMLCAALAFLLDGACWIAT